jgi:hypothetical protein
MTRAYAHTDHPRTQGAGSSGDPHRVCAVTLGREYENRETDLLVAELVQDVEAVAVRKPKV